MDFLSNTNLNNVAALATTASKVLVADGASNTIKYRTPAQIIADGGGTSASRTFQASLLGSQGGGDPTSANQIYINTGTTGYGWPHDGVDNQANSLLKATKFVIPFNPTNYRFSFVCAGNSSYSGSPTSGNFGIKFRYSTDNSTWTDITTVTLGSRSTGDFVTVNGALSISGSPSLVYIITEQTNSLSPSSDGYLYIRNLIADFWT